MASGSKLCGGIGRGDPLESLLVRYRQSNERSKGKASIGIVGPKRGNLCVSNKQSLLLVLIDQFGQLNVVPNSDPLGMKHFVSGISIAFKCNVTS